MIRVISSFADGPVNFHSTGPAEDQIQKLISSTDAASIIFQDKELKTKRKNPTVFITVIGLSGVQFGLQS